MSLFRLFVIVAFVLGCNGAPKDTDEPPATGAAIVAAVLLSACTRPVPGDRDRLESSMDTTIVYESGEAATEGGRTTLRVAPSGTVSVENQHNGQVRSFEGAIEPALASSLRTRLESSPVFTMQRRVSAQPDEAPVSLRLVVGDESVRSVELWDNQLGDAPDLRALQSEFRGIVRTVSGGEIY